MDYERFNEINKLRLINFEDFFIKMWLSHFIEKNLYIKTCIYKINFLKFLILSHFKSSQ